MCVNALYFLLNPHEYKYKKKANFNSTVRKKCPVPIFLFFSTFFVHSDDDLINNIIKNKKHIYFILFLIMHTKNNKMDYNNEIFELRHINTPYIIYENYYEHESDASNSSASSSTDKNDLTVAAVFAGKSRPLVVTILNEKRFRCKKRSGLHNFDDFWPNPLRLYDQSRKAM